VRGTSDQKGYVGLPYTLPQDFTLFVLMKEKNIEIWKKKGEGGRLKAEGKRDKAEG
jgi:hypothetical protein